MGSIWVGLGLLIPFYGGLVVSGARFAVVTDGRDDPCGSEGKPACESDAQMDVGAGDPQLREAGRIVGGCHAEVMQGEPLDVGIRIFAEKPGLFPGSDACGDLGFAHGR